MYPGVKNNRLSSAEMWVSKHAPSSTSDLGVHKKKVEEVLAWMERRCRDASRTASVLLLVGPTGVGKTTTLHVVARQLNVEVVEWINPLADASVDLSRSSFYEDFSCQDGFKESHMSKFAEFLIRTNRYPSLSIFGNETFRSKLLLVKDFPNAVLKDPKKFHEILNNHRKRGAGPLVFVINDNYSSNCGGEKLLFPPDIQSSLHIDVIRFNPIATTSMTKVLSRIAANESRLSPAAIRVPSAELIDQIVDVSGGDIRSAINSLQFHCLNNAKVDSAKIRPASLPTKNSRKRLHTSSAKSISKSAVSSNDEASIGVCDKNLTLFRALGKILHCKREERNNVEDSVALPNSLAVYRRDALAVVPEEVIEKSQISPDAFTAFLHQNFLDFYTDLNDIAAASEYLSDSDYLTRDWSSRSVLNQYSSSVAVRSVLFCNSSRATASSTGCSAGLGWKPLYKPDWFGAIKKCRDNRESVQSLFKEFQLPVTTLVMGLLPYIVILKSPSLSKSQTALAKEVTTLTRSSVRRLPEKLDEKDFTVLDESLDFQPTEQNSKGHGSHSQTKICSDAFLSNNLDDYESELLVKNNFESDDEFNIEEYDD